MINKFKANVLDGYYANHLQGDELLTIDLDAILSEHEVAIALENQGLIVDNKEFVKEVEELKAQVINLKKEVNTHQQS